MKIVMFGVLFLCAAAFILLVAYDIHLLSSEGRELFFEAYQVWFTGVFHKVREITGHVVGELWLPSSSFNISNMTNHS